MKRSEKTMTSLVNNLEKVNPILSPEKRLLRFLPVYSVLIIAMMLFIQPFRPHFFKDILKPQFTLELILSFATIIIAIYLSLLSVSPGRVLKEKLFWGLGLFLLWGGALVVSYFHPAIEPSMLGKRPTCVYEILAFSVIPFAHLLYLLRRGLIYYQRRTFFIASLGISMIPASLMHIACMYEPGHILKFHFMPVLIFSSLSTFFCYKFIRSRSYNNKDTDLV